MQSQRYYMFCTILCDLKKMDSPEVVLREEIINLTDDFDSGDTLLFFFFTKRLNVESCDCKRVLRIFFLLAVYKIFTLFLSSLYYI